MYYLHVAAFFFEMVSHAAATVLISPATWSFRICGLDHIPNKISHRPTAMFGKIKGNDLVDSAGPDRCSIVINVTAYIVCIVMSQQRSDNPGADVVAKIHTPYCLLLIACGLTIVGLLTVHPRPFTPYGVHMHTPRFTGPDMHDLKRTKHPARGHC